MGDERKIDPFDSQMRHWSDAFDRSWILLRMKNWDDSSLNAELKWSWCLMERMEVGLELVMWYEREWSTWTWKWSLSIFFPVRPFVRMWRHICVQPGVAIFCAPYNQICYSSELERLISPWCMKAVFRWESQMAGRSRQLLQSVMAPVIDALQDMNMDLDTVVTLDGRRSAQISSSFIVLSADPLYYTLNDTR